MPAVDAGVALKWTAPEPDREAGEASIGPELIRVG